MVGHAVMRVPDGSVVLAAACMTFAATASIMTYAACAKTDFTVCGPSIFMMGAVFAVTGIFIAIFAPKLHYMFACIGVILFGFFLLYDTQLIISGTYGGHRKY